MKKLPFWIYGICCASPGAAVFWKHYSPIVAVLYALWVCLLLWHAEQSKRNADAKADAKPGGQEENH